MCRVTELPHLRPDRQHRKPSPYQAQWQQKHIHDVHQLDARVPV